VCRPFCPPPPPSFVLSPKSPSLFARPDILEDLQSSFSWQDPNWHDKVIDKTYYHMADYISNLIYCLHWPEHAKTLSEEVYPGLRQLLPLIKNIDCFAELCVFTRWPEGEPSLNAIPEPAALDFPQV
jgi:hypothetical protein